MSELHWTGAAILLAVAVLGGRPRRAPGELSSREADGIASDALGRVGDTPTCPTTDGAAR